MKYLIVARHGDFQENGHLSNDGKLKVMALADKILALEQDKKITILCSPSIRTKETALIIGLFTGCDIEEKSTLLADLSPEDDFPSTLKLVREYANETEVLVLVTHCGLAEGFPYYFSKEEFGIGLQSHMIDKGRAWLIDCENKTLSLI